MNIYLWLKYFARRLTIKDKSDFFSEGYKFCYPECEKTCLTPWQHYVIVGSRKGYDNGTHPTEKTFFAAGYLEMYPDVAKAKVDPWRHYVLNGKQEGRDNGHHPGSESFFPQGYKYNYPSCIYEPYGNNLWLNFIKIGKSIKRNNGLAPVSPFFNGGYFERFPKCTVTQAWKNYVLNSLLDPNKELNLYLPETGMREFVRRLNPSVAVVMPVYNRKNVVTHAIESVRSQTWPNWHLYIVDDFSSDGTYEQLKATIFDSRISLLKSQHKGACGARNTALKNINKEDYVAYLDSDNTWNSEYLELMLCRLVETRTCCCYGVQKILKRREDGSSEITGFRYEPFDISALRLGNFIDLNVFMHRAGLIRELGVFDESLHRYEDWDLILRYAERYSFSRLPYVACNYSDSEDANRVTLNKNYSFSYGRVIRNKHWFDWNFLLEDSKKKDESLVSVIIYYGQNDSIALLQNCLQSIKLASKSGCSKFKTQIILVDDSCSDAGHQSVEKFYNKSLVDKYIVNKFICHFSLSCNRALTVADGAFVVYLDLHSYVSVAWLDSLISPLKRHANLIGTTSKIFQPDGTINSVGMVLDAVSGLPYDALHDLPSAHSAVQKLTLFPCVNSYCCAFRISDVVEKKGLDCIYESNLSIADLCLKLAGGQLSFAYIPNSCIECPSVRHAFAFRSNELKSFAERWHGKSDFDEQEYFARRKLSQLIKHKKSVCSIAYNEYTKCGFQIKSVNYSVPEYDLTKLKYGCDIGSDLKSVLQNLKWPKKLVVIKIPVPDIPYENKYEWGDYYYARCLAKNFVKLGFDTRIDFLESWYTHDDGFCINIVLRGLSKFECRKSFNSFNLLWIISHPDLVDTNELNEYDCVLIASETLVQKYLGDPMVHVPCIFLPQCTDPDIFCPASESANYSSKNLFVGNSRGVMRTSVKTCIESGQEIEVIGNGWSGFVKAEYIRSSAVPNIVLPFLYSNAETVLNDHWNDMRNNGIISNRIFDVISCGRGIVTDNIKNIPEDLKFCCFSWEESTIQEAIDNCRQFNSSITENQAIALHDTIREKYSFARRALQIVDILDKFKSSKRFKMMYLEMFNLDLQGIRFFNPKLSVIIPVYNGEKFIRNCLDSVLRQQSRVHDVIEVICVDDGSSDATYKILEEYKNTDPRLRIIGLDKKEHYGAGAARNIGLRIARGKFVHFVDADDQVVENSYSAWIDALEQTDADFSIARFIEKDFKTNKVLKICGEALEVKVSKLNISSDKFLPLYKDTVAPWNKLYKKSFILHCGLRFDETMIRNDRSFYISAVINATRVAYYSEPVYVHYVNRSDSLVFQSGKYFCDVVTVFKNVFEISKNVDINTFSDLMDLQFKDLFFWCKKCIGTDYEKDALHSVQDFLNVFCRENCIFEKCRPDIIKQIQSFICSYGI